MQLLNTLPILSLIAAGIAHPVLDAAMPSFLSKRWNMEGRLGQYFTNNCSDLLFKHRLSADGPTPMVAHHKIDVAPGLERGKCTPWYPYLDQKTSPSVGVVFGSGSGYIKQVQFFKSTPECAAAEAKSGAAKVPKVCCQEDAGGFLLTMSANLTGPDFGLKKDHGFLGSSCAQIGPGHDQTLWQTRYFISR